MAGQASLVICGSIMDKWLVRVVASDAGKARVAVAPTAALFKTIGLEAHIGDAGGTHFVDVIQGAMASATEIDESNGIHAPRIEDGEAALLPPLLIHQAYMFGAGAVTRLAGYSGHQM